MICSRNPGTPRGGNLERFEKVVKKVSDWLLWVAVAGFVAISVVTVIDVVGAKLFRQPVLWSFDLTGLLGLLLLVFALGYTQLQRGHIEIEFVSERLPARVQGVFDVFVALAGMVLFGLMTWQTLDFSLILQRTSRVTAIAQIPMAPLGYGAAFCFFIVLLVLFLQLLKAVAGMARK